MHDAIGGILTAYAVAAAVTCAAAGYGVARTIDFIADLTEKEVKTEGINFTSETISLAKKGLVDAQAICAETIEFQKFMAQELAQKKSGTRTNQSFIMNMDECIATFE